VARSDPSAASRPCASILDPPPSLRCPRRPQPAIMPPMTTDDIKPKPAWHLAQYNLARMVAPLDDPVMADFVANLVRINTLADESPGFVWRHQGEGGDSTGTRVRGDD